MSLKEWWRWYRALPQNPIYLREKGTWGNPNPFYDNLLRFSPFVLLGVIVLGFCTGFNNPAFFADNDALFAVYCLLCLPGILLSMLTIFGSLMAPALTAPTISMERDRGTWDILRVTPQPTASILLAKLFGALARLRIWPVLFLLSAFQGLIMFCSLTVMGGDTAVWGGIVGLMTLLRPWLEVLFAAFMGMFVSTAVRSATMALASTYALVVIVRLFNSSGVWLGVASIMSAKDTTMLIASSVGPTAVYLTAVLGLWGGILYQARRISE
ncbi:MAG: ABC transporter permease subunit [Chloroflexi bacterium]|nr:ABC transporter permease subunit [Chloroflexota bacterium]